MESVTFSGYTENDKLEIARKYLLPRQRSQAGLNSDQLELSDGAISGVDCEPHPRSGSSPIGAWSLARWQGRWQGASRRMRLESESVTKDDVSEILGRPTVHPEHAATQDEIGIATGLFYTPAGGDIMFVEVSVMPGKDKLVLTGPAR